MPRSGLDFLNAVTIPTASELANIKSMISTSGCNDLNVFSAIILLPASPTILIP